MNGTARAELHDAFAGEERGVAVCTLRGERAGQRWAMHVVQVYRFRDGRVSEIRNYIYDLYAADEINS
jgi:ketosteroid isomerase-like protein